MSRVLLLNASYEPICAVMMPRAIALLLQGKAHLLESREGASVRSSSTVLEYPTVIRLERYVRIPYRRSGPVTRTGILRRDGYCCVYCGEDGRTIDHIVPRSRGGDSSWLNLAACCQRCNNRKGNSLVSELGWKMRFHPYEPDYRTYVIAKQGARREDPTWREYLGVQQAA